MVGEVEVFDAQPPGVAEVVERTEDRREVDIAIGITTLGLTGPGLAELHVSGVREQLGGIAAPANDVTDVDQ